MPKKRQVTLYSIDELSEEARQHAVEDFGPHAFDDADTATLTEDFTEILKERGFKDGVKVNWSLGYCQGDGVCFEGWMDLPYLIELEKLEKFAPLVPLAARGILTAHVQTNDDSRYCHKYTMSVDLELRGDVIELLPEELQEQWREWQDEVRRRMRAWLDDIHLIDWARGADRGVGASPAGVRDEAQERPARVESEVSGSGPEAATPRPPEAPETGVSHASGPRGGDAGVRGGMGHARGSGRRLPEAA